MEKIRTEIIFDDNTSQLNFEVDKLCRMCDDIRDQARRVDLACSNVLKLNVKMTADEGSQCNRSQCNRD